MTNPRSSTSPRSSFTQILLTRRYRVAAAVLTVSALIMTRIPLLGDPGFEFTMAMSFIAAWTGGFFAIYHLQACRSTFMMNEVRFLPVFAGVSLVALSTLVFPLGVILVKSVFSGLCNPLEGLLFFALMPGITTTLAVGMGMLCAIITPRPRYAALLFTGYVLGAIGLGLYRMITQPPVFAYNPIIGYFPGPIYDEVIRITPTLLIARGLDMLWAVAVAAGLHVMVDPRTWRLRPGRWLSRYLWPGEAGLSAARACALIALMLIGLSYIYRAPLGLVIDRDHIQKTLGGHAQTDHFDIYYDRDSTTARHIDRIALDHEYQLSRLTEYLNTAPPSRRIGSYIYASPPQKKRLMGAGETSMERPGEDEMHLNDAAFPHPVMKHELAHVVSSAFGNGLYGGSYLMGLHEGLAVAADWEADRLTPHQWSRAMRILNLAPPLETIIGTVGFWSAAPARAYMLCGSFVRFLIDRYGVETFKKAFPNGNMTAAYGKPLPTLIREWETFVDELTLTEDELRMARQRFLSPGIFERRCPHEVASLVDQAMTAYNQERYYVALQFFDRAGELDPQNTTVLRGLLYASYRLGSYDRADTLADHLISRADIPVGLMADAWLTRGDLSWKRGEIDRARACYGRTLELRASERADREAMVKLASLEKPETRGWVLEYLTATTERSAHIVLVTQTLLNDPEFSVGYYLVGRLLYNSQIYRYAIPYFKRADMGPMTEPPLKRENLLLLGQCYFFEKNYDAALETFQRLFDDASAPVSLVEETGEWMRRCRWFRENEKKYKPVLR